MNLISLIVILGILEFSQSLIIDQQVDHYDIAHDYVNDLSIIVYSKQNQIYMAINYFELENIHLGNSILNMTNVMDIKLVYPSFEEKRQNQTPIMLVIQNNNDLFVFRSEEVGYQKTSAEIHWTQTFEVTDIQGSWDISYSRTKINERTGWLLCYDIVPQFFSGTLTNYCHGSNDGITWVSHQESPEADVGPIKILPMKTPYYWMSYPTTHMDGYALFYNAQGDPMRIDYSLGLFSLDSPIDKLEIIPGHENQYLLISRNTTHSIHYSSTHLNEVMTLYSTVNGFIHHVLYSPTIHGWYLLVDDRIFKLTESTLLLENVTPDPVFSSSNPKEKIQMISDHKKSIIITYLENGNLIQEKISIEIENPYPWEYEKKLETPLRPSRALSDQTILGHLFIETNMTLSGEINIEGNLTLTESNLILDNSTAIEISGKFHIDGNLYLNNYNQSSTEEIKLFGFNETNGQEFDQVYLDGEILPCHDHLNYLENSITIIFDASDDCNENLIEDDFPLYGYLIIICGSIFVVISVGTIILMVKFRRQLFPYRDPPPPE